MCVNLYMYICIDMEREMNLLWINWTPSNCWDIWSLGQ